MKMEKKINKKLKFIKKINFIQVSNKLDKNLVMERLKINFIIIMVIGNKIKNKDMELYNLLIQILINIIIFLEIENYFLVILIMMK